MSSPCHIELILSEKEEPETQFKKSSGNDIDSDKYKMLTASTLGYDPDLDDMEKVVTLKGNAATTEDRPPKKLKCLCGAVLGQPFKARRRRLRDKYDRFFESERMRGRLSIK